MDEKIAKYLSEIGRQGGRKSRRELSPEQAKRMVKVREARRAYRNFYAQCFWSFKKDLRVSFEDIPWVVENLRKNGNRRAWELAEKLCH